MNLFDRLPIGIFGPLSGRNARRAWDLIQRLATRYFGPDAVPPYPDGYLHDQITKEIERFLLDQRWQTEDGAEDLTPLNIQANMLQQRLVDTGWLVEDRIGAKVFVNMRPIVIRFSEALQQFSEEGPQLIGGNVQLVHNQLLSVVANPRDQAQGFSSAAMLCVRLINALNTTTLRARDLMKELKQEHNTPTFVRRFFSEHIAELYIRDFQDLRTENHPLRLRWEILDLVSRVTNEPRLRSELLAGYAALAKPSEAPEEMLERDIRRFERLLDVERFLERMDHVMEQATQHAIAYLSYRLKASDRIEAVLGETVKALNQAECLGLEVIGRLFGPAPVVCDSRLRMPAPPPVQPLRRPMRKRQLSIHERAMIMLRREMQRHRDSSPSAMRKYVDRHTPINGWLSVEDMPTESVEDAVAHITLLHLGILLEHRQDTSEFNPLIRSLGFDVRLSDADDPVETDLYVMPGFAVRRSLDDAS